MAGLPLLVLLVMHFAALQTQRVEYDPDTHLSTVSTGHCLERAAVNKDICEGERGYKLNFRPRIK
jgi:hypothetical protein